MKDLTKQYETAKQDSKEFMRTGQISDYIGSRGANAPTAKGQTSILRTGGMMRISIVKATKSRPPSPV